MSGMILCLNRLFGIWNGLFLVILDWNVDAHDLIWFVETYSFELCGALLSFLEKVIFSLPIPWCETLLHIIHNDLISEIEGIKFIW